MKFQPNRKRSAAFIFLILFTGMILGTALGQLIGFIVPPGVVQDFFTKSMVLGWDPARIDLNIISFTIGFHFRISVLSIIGLAGSWYYLRYFR